MTQNLSRLAAASLVTCVLSACATAADAPPQVASPAVTPPTRGSVFNRDAHETLNAYLWMQTSAEYQSLMVGLYRSAQGALDRALADRTWTALPAQTTGYADLPPAVVVDVDETVLDNSLSQAQFILDGTPYVSSTWRAWVDKAAAPALPGAKAFVDFAESRGVAIFCVTNRSLAEQARTIDNLNAVGLKASDATVLVPGENGWTSDKTARRAEVARTHRVLLLIGDDLNDFVSTASLSPAERRALAEQHTTRWGTSWFLLPNPQYGTWDRALHPGITDDAAILRRKRELIQGFR